MQRTTMRMMPLLAFLIVLLTQLQLKRLITIGDGVIEAGIETTMKMRIELTIVAIKIRATVVLMITNLEGTMKADLEVAIEVLTIKGMMQMIVTIEVTIMVIVVTEEVIVEI